MKHPKFPRPILCLLLALLTACASPSPEALRAGSVCRRPEAAVSFWGNGPGGGPWPRRPAGGGPAGPGPDGQGGCAFLRRF